MPETEKKQSQQAEAAEQVSAVQDFLGNKYVQVEMSLLRQLDRLEQLSVNVAKAEEVSELVAATAAMIEIAKVILAC